MARSLTEREALLIEITEDTTQPDPARRAGLIELSVIESRHSEGYAPEMSRRAPHQPRRPQGGGKVEPYLTDASRVDGFCGVFEGVIT